MSDSISTDGRHGFRFSRHCGFPLATGNFAAHLVGHAAACDLNQPAPRILGNTLLRPLREGRDHGLLHRILGGGEVAKTASDCAEHLRRKFAQQMLGSRVPWLLSSQLRYNISGGGAAHNWPHFDWHVQRRSARPGAAEALAAIA